MDKKSQEELERPAKVYQVDALHTELIGVRKLLEDQNILLKGAVSLPYLEERLKGLDDKFVAQIEVIRGEYTPVLGNAKWAARTAIGAFVTLGLTLIGIYLKS